MSDMFNRLLRPPATLFFEKIYPRLPANNAMLWFFCKQYFIEGYGPVYRSGSEFGDKLQAFASAGYRLLLNFCTEDAVKLQEAAHTRNFYYTFLIRAISASRLESSTRLSIKMSQFGCFNQNPGINAYGRQAAETIIGSANKHRNIGITLDGERLAHAATVMDFAQAANKKYGNVAVRLQAYNPRFNELLDASVKKNIAERNIIPIGICKGAYHEPTALSADKTYENILEATLDCAEKAYPVSVDTNDHRLIADIRKELRCSAFRNKPRPSFGLLYGVKPWLARKLKNEGESVYIYFPVIETRRANAEGARANRKWEKYAMRRVMEHPLYGLYPFFSFANRLLGKNNYFDAKEIRQ